MGNHVRKPIVTSGMFMYYDALNPKSYPGSGITWKSLHPFGDATLKTVGSTLPTYVGGGIQLNGTGSGTLKTGNYISMPWHDSIFPSSIVDRSYCMWLHPNTENLNTVANTYKENVILTRNQSTGPLSWQYLSVFWKDANTVSFMARKLSRLTNLRGADRRADVPIASTNNKVVHVTFTITSTNPANWKIYFNGVEVVGAYTTENSLLGTDDFNSGVECNVGVLMPTQDKMFYGIRMHQLVGYTRVLTATEVAQNFDAHRKLFNL